MKKLMSALLLSVVAIVASAVPAKRDSISVVQPDGSTVTVFLVGDERAHLYYTTDGMPVNFDKSGALRYAHLDGGNIISTDGAPLAANPDERSESARRYLQNLEKIDFAGFYEKRLMALTAKKAKATSADDGYFKIGNFPTKGKIKGLVLLVEFQDKRFHYGQDFHNKMMNEEGFSLDNGTGSARDYFIDQSYSTFQPDFAVVGPITLSREMSYYGANDAMGNDANLPLMISEACNLAKSQQGLDFSQFDYDNDGFVDMVYLIYAGYGEHAGGGTNTIWPQTGNYEDYGKKLQIDGKHVNKFACSSELVGKDGTQSSGIGVFCHEFSHVLGLADHYSTKTFANRPYFLGYYDLMDYGNYNNESRTPAGYTAFERYTLGWISPEEATEPKDGVVLQPLVDSRQAFKLNTPNKDEFFMLENRQKKGWDTYLPSAGMMITYVDFDRGTWEKNMVNTTNRPRYAIVPADNSLNFGDAAGDLYPTASNDQFTDESNPSSLAANNRKTDRWVTSIKRDGENITFNFMANHLPKPVVLPPSNIGEDSFTANWEAVASAKRYAVNLYKVTSKSHATVALDEDFSSFTYGTVDSPSRTNISSELDEYTKLPGWTGERVYSAGGWAKIGSSGQDGFLATPALDLSANGGTHTVVVTARPEAGMDNTVLAVSSNDEVRKGVLAQDATTYVALFSNGTANSNIKISTAKALALIDEVKVLRGDASAEYPDAVRLSGDGEAQVSTTAAPMAQASEDDFIDVLVRTDTVAETHIKYEGLEKARYRYSVIALDDNRSSFESALADADLSSTGIGSAADDVEKTFSVKLDGRNIFVIGKPEGTAVDVYSPDGKLLVRTTSARFTLQQKGIYIIRIAEKAQKVIVE